MSSKNDTADKMAALRKLAINDVPPVVATMQAAAPPPAVKPAAKPKPAKIAKVAAVSGDGGRERTAVSLSMPAVEAMRKIQAMLIGEGGKVSASGVISAALQYAASNLTNDKKRLIDLYAANEQNDGRRRVD